MSFLLLVVVGLLSHSVLGQGADVSLHVRVNTAKQPGKHVAGVKEDLAISTGVVVWLEPENAEALNTAPSRPQQSYRMVQKDKQFSPHMLVVPTGTNVEFPNLDPFFHNVFSLFNGKRFDLGLYEAGSRRTVRFDREGVSYIFCNIHPQMGAVIVSLKTPYYAVSAPDGLVTIHNVPSGVYRLHLWAETIPASALEKEDREVRVQANDVVIGEIVLPAGKDIMAGHKNKFGDDYKKDPANPY